MISIVALMSLSGVLARLITGSIGAGLREGLLIRLGPDVATDRGPGLRRHPVAPVETRVAATPRDAGRHPGRKRTESIVIGNLAPPI